MKSDEWSELDMLQMAASRRRLDTRARSTPSSPGLTARGGLTSSPPRRPASASGSGCRCCTSAGDRILYEGGAGRRSAARHAGDPDIYAAAGRETQTDINSTRVDGVAVIIDGDVLL